MIMENFSKHADRLKLNYRAGYLISGFIRKILTREEEEELDEWILASEENMKLFEDLTDEQMMDDFLRWYSERDTEANLQKVKKRIKFRKRSPVISILRYVAAACIVLLIGTGIYFMVVRNDNVKPAISTIKQDIQPGSKLATLKLSNGQTILLDEIKDSVINEQIHIKDGEIIYTNETNEVSTHEIIIPRKGYYKLVLPDGTKVWLNAESSIKYPSSFTTDERKVEVTGETYFEVAKDASKPFIVSVHGINVQAFGTAFNINAYTNEVALKTTLIEGSIKVSNNNKQQILKANEQVNIDGDDWKMLKNVETGSITAWTNNKFKLKNNSIEEVMHMVERWYDAKIIYANKVNFHFNGVIDRDLPVSELLKLLEETGHVHFTINDNTITVRK